MSALAGSRYTWAVVTIILGVFILLHLASTPYDFVPLGGLFFFVFSCYAASSNPAMVSRGVATMLCYISYASATLCLTLLCSAMCTIFLFAMSS